MPNIGIHGYSVPQSIKKKIDECMQGIGLEKEAVTEIFRTEAISCDGSDSAMPFLKIFSSEFHFILPILEAFSKNGVHEDIEIDSERKLFISKEEMKSGAWREKIHGKESYLLWLSLKILRARLSFLGSEMFMGELKAIAEVNGIPEDEMLKLCKAVLDPEQ